MNISKFIEELKRRNVFKVATAYAIAGWLIIQVFATIAPQLGFPEWIAPFITILVLIGFPLALIFAWAFELTPDGIQKSNEVEITESVTESTGKKLNKIIISTLGILVILLLSERIFFAESTIFDADKLNVESASIAVLPFVNMSDDRSNEYFSDGLSEELLNALAKVEDMKVAARTSSFKFKGQNENLKLIGDELGVSHILEGSVRRAGNQVRITAQLIKVDDGFHLWSETFDRELTVNNVFAIQEEISRTVLTELKVQLLPEEAEAMAALPTQDIEAYNLYLEATQLEPSRRPEELEQAIEKYKQAIAIDPNFALAHARLAIAYTLLGDYGNIQYEEMISEAQYYSCLLYTSCTLPSNKRLFARKQELKIYLPTHCTQRVVCGIYSSLPNGISFPQRWHNPKSFLPDRSNARSSLTSIFFLSRSAESFMDLLFIASILEILPIAASKGIGFVSSSNSVISSLNFSRLDSITFTNCSCSDAVI